MNKIVKTFGFVTSAIAMLIGFTACNNSTTTKRKTTKNNSTTSTITSSTKQTTNKTTAKKTTSKKTTTKKSTNPSQTKYSITLKNVPSGVTVTPTVNGSAIDISGSYSKGTIIDFNIRNTSNKYYRVTATMNNKKYSSLFIDRCYDSTDPDEIFNGVLEGVELIDNLTISFKEIDEDDTSALTIFLDERNDTETLKNEVYVYEPGTWGKAYDNDDEIIVGQKLNVALKNYASDITLTVRAGDELIKKQTYTKLELNNDPLEICTITVPDEGVVYIETDCGSSSSSISATLIDGMSFLTSDISYTLYENDNVIESGAEISLNSTIKCEVDNNSEYDIILVAYYEGGLSYDSIRVEPGCGATLEKEATDSVIFAIEYYTKYEISYNTLDTNTSLNVISNKTQVINNNSYMRYSIIELTATNSTDKDYMLLLKMRDEYEDLDCLDFSVRVNKNSTYTYELDLYLLGALDIMFVEDRQFTYTLNNPYESADDFIVYAAITDGGSVSSGDKISVGQEISIATDYASEGTYTITISMAGTVIKEETINKSSFNSGMFKVTGDIVVTVTKI